MMIKSAVMHFAPPAALGGFAVVDVGTIEGIPIAGLTAPALLGIAILMLLTGRLWTNNAYQEKCKESDHWRLAYEAERENRQTSDSQTAQLLEVTKTTHAFIVAVFSNSERIRQGGGPNVVSSTPQS